MLRRYQLSKFGNSKTPIQILTMDRTIFRDLSNTNFNKPNDRVANIFKTFKWEGTMQIKFDRVESVTTKPNASGKTYSQLMVVGEAMSGKLEGQEWSCKFFKNNKDMAGKAQALLKGQIVDVKQEQNGKFWNPVDLTVVDSASGGGGSPGVAPSVASGACACENERFTYLKAAAKMQADGLFSVGDEVWPVIETMGEAADCIGGYVNKTGPFQFPKDTSDGIPEVDVEE